MKLINGIFGFIGRLLYYPKWRCFSCGKEVFDDECFCAECRKKLPFIEGAVCEHCGRQVIATESYCSTCKGVLTQTDRARSVFNYEKSVAALIKRAKYDNARYVLTEFADYLASAYYKYYFNSALLVCVPMTRRALKRRGYNQSEILARLVSEKTGVPFADVLIKVKETKRQVKLSANERRKNLSGAFRVTDKTRVRGKSVLIIDDVTTTGSTGEALAEKLKKAGAERVELLTIASVPPKAGY